MAWYVLHTKQHREELVTSQLAQHGLITYAPLIEEWPPPAVGGPCVPMFPGYVFAQLTLPDDHYRATRTFGVKRLVAFGNEPAVMPDDAVMLLKRQADADGVIHSPLRRDEACSVRIARGPFRGLHATVARRLTNRQRVVVLMQLLSRETRVELPETWVCQA